MRVGGEGKSQRRRWEWKSRKKRWEGDKWMEYLEMEEELNRRGQGGRMERVSGRGVGRRDRKETKVVEGRWSE